MSLKDFKEVELKDVKSLNTVGGDSIWGEIVDTDTGTYNHWLYIRDDGTYDEHWDWIGGAPEDKSKGEK